MDFNLHTFFFYLIACETGLCAIGVVVTQNIVRSAAWLLFTLAGVSGIFFLLNADFVGATQLLMFFSALARHLDEHPEQVPTLLAGVVRPGGQETTKRRGD